MKCSFNDCSVLSVFRASSRAVLTIEFRYFWDLLSVHQRQYALHLTDPKSFEAATETPSPLCGRAWSVLPHSLREKILKEFIKLPGVHSVGL